MSGHRSFQLIEGEVSRLDASPATPRRRWSVSAKEEIVAKSMMPGVNVSALARAHGIAPSQVFAWRRKAVVEAKAAIFRGGGASPIKGVEAGGETSPVSSAMAPPVRKALEQLIAVLEGRD